MWTLYGSDGSGSAAVEMALLRCNQPYRVVRASTWEADSAQAQLRQANPLGQIPTLQGEDGSVLTESAAILIQLGLLYPASGLLPAEPAARGQALRGLVYIAAQLLRGHRRHRLPRALVRQHRSGRPGAASPGRQSATAPAVGGVRRPVPRARHLPGRRRTGRAGPAGRRGVALVGCACASESAAP